MVAHLKSKVYADLWFSIGAVPKKKKTAYDKNYDRDYSEQFNSCVKVNQHYGGAQYDEITWLEGQIEAHNRFISSLKSSQTRPRYGMNGITARGKRTVKGASAFLQKKYGKSKLGFCTLTLPDYCANQIRIIAQDWSNILRVFFQKLKRELGKLNIPNEVVGVTEIQTKRFNKHGVIAPHIHFVYVARANRNSQFYIHASRLRQMWKEVLIKRVGVKNSETNEEVEFGASVDCQVIKKNVSNYLGKYMSKGGAVIGDILDAERGEELPRTWWTISKALRTQYLADIKSLTHDAVSLIFYNPEHALKCKLIRWYQEIYVDICGEPRLVGVVGYMSNDEMVRICTQ